jgi:hypothetical protein
MSGEKVEMPAFWRSNEHEMGLNRLPQRDLRAV